MSNSRMVDAVNRLVGNLLAGAGEVTLPGVGSLYVQRCAARRVAKNRVVPPCRSVAFRSEERGASLVDEIAAAARVDAAKAQEIYDTWRARVSGEHRLTIEGVGELRYKSFVLDPAFDAQLNPQGHEPVRLRTPRRRFDFVLWLGIAAILFVAGFVGYWWKTEGRRSLAGAERAVAVVANAPAQELPDAAADAAEGIGGAVDSVGQTARPDAGAADSATAGGQLAGAASPGAAPAADAAYSEAGPAAEGPQAAAPAADPDAVHALRSGQRYVVLGVFSSEANAFRAARQAREKEETLRPAVYRFGEKFLVSPFDASDAESCTQFIRARADLFPGMWTYTAR